MRTQSSHMQNLSLDLDLRVAEDWSAVPGVRRRVAAALADLHPDDRDAVVLVGDELLTNAYEHGCAPRRFTLRRRPADGTLTAGRQRDRWLVSIAVQDSSPDPPVPGTSRRGGGRGYGLVLVGRLARDWGTTFHGAHGKTVWAQILCGAPGSEHAPAVTKQTAPIQGARRHGAYDTVNA